jgi:glycosyltransferase involved in cell wall biosynthesis
VHQENGGHGMAVNTGLRHASGTYFKVVDADDWLSESAAQEMLILLEGFAASEQPVDMVIANYVYERVYSGKSQTIRYTSAIPEDKVFCWQEMGALRIHQNILMHSVIYRTALLRGIGFELPAHTFYVDNIFVYVPLPHVKTIYYRDVDLYRYFIGREGQSVNEKVMLSRIDQQLRITRIMIDAYDLDKDVSEPVLREYMEDYLAMMMAICTVFLHIAAREDKGSDEPKEKRKAIWKHLEENNPGAYARIRKSFIGRGAHLRGRLGQAFVLGCYRLARGIFKFN